MTTYGATPRNRRIAVAGMTGAAVLAFGGPAVADEGDGFEQPPGYEAPAVPEVDADAPGLMLGDGATLDEPQVLDIKSVTEDLGTGETEETGDTGSTPTEEPAEEIPGQTPDSGGQREEQTSGQHKFTLQTDVLFGKNSDELSGEAVEALRDVATAIDEYQPGEVHIYGFTDNLGSYEHGLVLSDARARNTHEALLGLIEDPSGISFDVRGYSEDFPLYDNATEDGRTQNRRVEISWPTGE